MATRSLPLRLLASLLLVLWVALGVVIIVAYRPGGPIDFVPGLATLLPATVVAAAVVWPMESTDPRMRLATTWLGIVAALLVAPLLITATEAFSRGANLPVVPSLEIGYAGVLAAATSCIFGCLGVARRLVAPAAIRAYITTAVGLGAALAIVGAVVFAGASIVTAQALLAHAPPSSDFGPIDPSREPPHCEFAPILGPGGDVHIEAKAVIDGHAIGSASVSGVRSGRDEAWTGESSGDFTNGELAYSRLGSQALLSADGAAPRTVDPATFALAGDDGSTLDPPVVATILGGAIPSTNEELGFDLFDGASARHCRRAIDGTTALDTFVVLRWLAARDPFVHTEALAVWRGEIDWWIFIDGQLGRATLLIGGYPGDAWPSSGISATIELTLTALRREQPHMVVPLQP